MRCTECNGRGKTIYYAEIARSADVVTVEQRECICRTCNGSGEQPKTNADRIRAMSDEELSTIMVQMADLDVRIPYCKNLPECDVLLDTEDGIPIEMCANCMLAWLKQPAEVDNG